MIHSKLIPCGQCGSMIEKSNWETGDKEIDTSIRWDLVVCTTCDEERIMLKNKNEDRLNKERNQLAIRESYSLYGLPEYHAKLDCYALLPDLTQFVDSVMKNTSMGLFLTGPGRSGKTAVSVHTAKMAMSSNHKRVMFFTAADIFGQFVDLYRQDDMAVRAFINKLVNLDLLIIDDWTSSDHKVKMTETKQEAAFRLINALSEARAPARLFITTNDTASEFKGVNGESLAQRIAELCICTNSVTPQLNRTAS